VQSIIDSVSVQTLVPVVCAVTGVSEILCHGLPERLPAALQNSLAPILRFPVWLADSQHGITFLNDRELTLSCRGPHQQIPKNTFPRYLE
jgi:hypothetical protein